MNALVPLPAIKIGGQAPVSPSPSTRPAKSAGLAQGDEVCLESRGDLVEQLKRGHASGAWCRLLFRNRDGFDHLLIFPDCVSTFHWVCRELFLPGCEESMCSRNPLLLLMFLTSSVPDQGQQSVPIAYEHAPSQ
jgi:hypothetical protein